MAWKPKPACPVCRRLNCTDPKHKRESKPRGVRRLERPDYNTSAERRRRRAAVDQFLAEHGHRLDNGDTIARCPECGQMRARFVADHTTPLAMGGSEQGPLGIQCAVCSGRQGARIANAKRKR